MGGLIVKSSRPVKRAQNAGSACPSDPPTLTGNSLATRPVRGSVYIATPLSVASPSAGVKRPVAMPVRKRLSGSSTSTPITES